MLGVSRNDSDEDASYIVGKAVNLRIFADDQERFNRSALEIGAELLVVSQFTLYGDTRKGRRPSFTAAAGTATAKPLYEYFVACCQRRQIPVATGHFQAHMAVQLVNDGPVTLLIDTAERGPRQKG